MRRRSIILTMACCVAGATLTATFGTGGQQPDRANAAPPDPSLCSGNSSFCGTTLRVESSTGTIRSVAAGAHYGPAWNIPTSGNDSTGTGWCVDDTHTGFPVGPIVEQKLPDQWTDTEMRHAAAVIALYGGDEVSEHQSLAVDSDGELAASKESIVSPTRLRHVAVWFALRSLLPDPSGRERIDLTTARTFIDAAGTQPSRIGRDAVALARQLVAGAAEITTNGPPVVTVSLIDEAPPMVPGTSASVRVHVADPDGRPLPHYPVRSSRADNIVVTADTMRTDATGVAEVAIEIEQFGAWEVEFATETFPIGVRVFGDGVNAQNNVTIDDRTESAAGILGGVAAEPQHDVIIQKKVVGTAGFGNDLSGFVFSIRAPDGTRLADVTTDEAGATGAVPLLAGEYEIHEIERPGRWPSDKTTPQPKPFTVPGNGPAPLIVEYRNTLPPPTIATEASDSTDGDDHLTPDGGTIVDEVTVCNTVEGTDYRIVGELVFVPANGQPSEATKITSSHEFTPGKATCAEFELRFDVPATAPWLRRDGHLVVTEELLVGDTIAARHDDLTSATQSVFVPKVESEATDLDDGDKEIDVDGAVIAERLVVRDIDPSIDRIDVESKLMLLAPDGEITPSGATGRVSLDRARLVEVDETPIVEIPVDPSHLTSASGVGVVFTTLTDAETGLVIVEHHQPGNVAQQVFWSAPHVTTATTPNTSTPTTTASMVPPTTDLPAPSTSASAPRSRPSGATLPNTGSNRTETWFRIGSLVLFAGSLLFCISSPRHRDERADS